jgi:trimethylamine--corrinoid protein Co-methyltransferase
MQPKLSLLDDELIARVLDETYQLMIKPGIKVQNTEARQLLADAGAQVDEESMIVRIPTQIVRKALETVPRQFHLYDSGSSGICILIPETLEHKTAETDDLIRLIKVAESLPQYDAQSTVIVCHDVPKDIHDLYRLYLVMLYSKKPIVTGAFTNKTVYPMIECSPSLPAGMKTCVSIHARSSMSAHRLR